MRDALQVHGALSRGVFAVVVLVSLAVLFAPASDVPSAPPGVDKVVHVALFAALAISGRWAGCAAAPLGWLLLGYAVVSELIQGFTPLARSASLIDGVADLAGILLGLALWAVLGRRRSPTP
ncbi:VanZ family protein [Blastococcus sp. SYSU D00922]